MPEKHHVGTDEQLSEDGSRLIAEIAGREIAIFRLDGEYFGVLNFCVHQGGPLCEGNCVNETVVAEDGWSWNLKRQGQVISCPWHSWKFDIMTGENIDDPQYRVPTYDVVLENGELFVII